MLEFLPILSRIILISSSIGAIILLAIIASRSKRRITDYLLMISILAISFWSLGLFFMISFNKPWATTLTFASPIFILVGQVWFIKIFPEDKFPAKIYSYWSLLPLLFLLIITFQPDLIFQNVKIINNYYIKGDNGPFGSFYSLSILFYICYSIFLLLKRTIKEKRDIIKIQFKYLTIGFILFFIINVLTNSILPVFFGIYFFNGIGPVFSLILFGFIIYIITHYNFLGIRIIIQKGLIYTTLLVLIVGFYLANVFVLGYLFQKVTHLTVLVSAGLTVIVGIFGVPPLKRYFTKATDKIFFKDKYDYSQAIHELSEILNKNINLEDITGKTSEKLKEIMKTKKAVFSVIAQEKQNEEPVQEAGEGELKIDIALEDTPIGAIILGKKLSGDPYTDEDMKLLQTFAYQAGVALKKSELYEIMKNYSCELEEKVIQRTAKIEELHGEQKQIMMDISHGLQTPLTIIKGELGLLKKQNISAENFATLEKSIDRISKFIYDLLRLARLEMFEGDFKKEPVNLSRMLNDLTDEFNIMSKEKNITVISDISPDIIILGDKSKLEELVTNLVSNAVKYISNERKIFINLRKINHTIKLDVKDTGIGISEKDLPNVFNRFYRVKENNHIDAKGTGLGLAICKKITEKHGGAIGAESVPGKGTIFTVVLPAQPAA